MPTLFSIKEMQMFTKNELEFIKTTLNTILHGSHGLLDVKEMNKEARAMLFDITSKIMMKQRGDDPSTWKSLFNHLQEQKKEMQNAKNK